MDLIRKISPTTATTYQLRMCQIVVLTFLALNEGALASVMEAFPEREREAILHEIQCMREVIHDGDANFHEVSSDDEQSSFEGSLIVDDSSGSATFISWFNAVTLTFFS